MEVIRTKTELGEAIMTEGEHSGAAIGMAIHDMAMDKDNPQRACTGRAGKHFMAALDNWIDEEGKRAGTKAGTTVEVMLNTSVAMATTVLINALLAIVGPAHMRHYAGQVFCAFASAFQDAVLACDKNLNHEAEKKSA